MTVASPEQVEQFLDLIVGHLKPVPFEQHPVMNDLIYYGWWDEHGSREENCERVSVHLVAAQKLEHQLAVVTNELEIQRASRVELGRRNRELTARLKELDR